MHNPFPLYSPRLLKGMLQAGHAFFVRQTYPRGSDHFNKPKGTFLISPYPDVNRANLHFEAIKNDRHRFLYDISKPRHIEKLHLAAAQPEGYKIYAPLLPAAWKPSDLMAGKIRRYIAQHLQWRPGRDGVQSNLFLQFGELFITLRSGTQEVKIPLSAVERL